MSHALIFTLTLGMATAAPMYEWKGIFSLPEDKYIWGAQKVSGKYVDPTMTLAAIPTSAATQHALDKAGSAGTTALTQTCEAVNSGGTITPEANKCYKLVFDQTKGQSLFNIDTSKTNSVAFFTQHLPTEFEDTEHYLKDKTGVDIEPVAQDPDPGSGGHSHGHGSGHDATESKCVCQAADNNWKLDCTKKTKIEESVANLEKDASCKAKNPPQKCINDYYVMQAHHDHCLHNDLPTGIEHKLHVYEQFYDDCFVRRQFDPNLATCPKVDCDNQAPMTQAVAVLQAGCATSVACADAACAAAIKTVLMAHDACPETSLPNNLEVALHDHEEPCAAQLCNSATAAFDPYADSCSQDASAAGGHVSQEAFWVTTSVLSLAVCSLLL